MINHLDFIAFLPAPCVASSLPFYYEVGCLSESRPNFNQTTDTP